VAKKFLFVCGGILMLALAYHFGATSAGAQAAGNPVVSGFSGGGAPITMSGGVVTANGDVYVTGDWVTWTHLSNVFTGPPTPAHATSFGALKVKYR
jgi:hypothetical protein